MAIEKKNFPLKHSIEYRGATYNEFNARRPKVRDIRTFIKNVEKDGMLAIEKALADLFEVDNTIIAEIDPEDFGPMKAWFEGFLELMAGASEQS
jgi:hypothetical protein